MVLLEVHIVLLVSVLILTCWWRVVLITALLLLGAQIRVWGFNISHQLILDHTTFFIIKWLLLCVLMFLPFFRVLCGILRHQPPQAYLHAPRVKAASSHVWGTLSRSQRCWWWRLRLEGVRMLLGRLWSGLEGLGGKGKGWEGLRWGWLVYSWEVLTVSKGLVNIFGLRKLLV